jgi:hypothetical protein
MTNTAAGSHPVLLNVYVVTHSTLYLSNSASDAANYQNAGGGTKLQPFLVDLSILRLDDQIDLIPTLGWVRPLPSRVLLPHREACDPEVLSDIIDHQRHESHIGRERNDQCGQNK